MKKDITNMNIDDIEKKIIRLKEEESKIEFALMRYEAELLERTKKVPLGVPNCGCFYVCSNNGIGILSTDKKPEQNAYNVFGTKESAIKHSEMLKEWRLNGLIANSDGKPITIDVLKPLFPKGKVLYSPYNKKWKWVDNKTNICPNEHDWFLQGGNVITIEGFNIKPADDWEESVMECGL